MNKYLIADYLEQNKRYNKEEKILIQAIEEAREEINRTEMYFQYVNDPKLVEYAIFMQAAAKARYVYLTNEAKRTGLKVENEFILTNLNVG